MKSTVRYLSSQDLDYNKAIGLILAGINKYSARLRLILARARVEMIIIIIYSFLVRIFT